MLGDKDLGERTEMEKGHGKEEVPGLSLVKLVAESFTRHGPGLERSPNRVSYPTSTFDNVRNGF
jgi:chitinase